VGVVHVRDRKMGNLVFVVNHAPLLREFIIREISIGLVASSWLPKVDHRNIES
jgi:hypothetical protein